MCAGRQRCTSNAYSPAVRPGSIPNFFISSTVSLDLSECFCKEEIIKKNKIVALSKVNQFDITTKL